MKSPWLPAIVVFALSAAGVSRTQPGLARLAYETKEKDDLYELPPPDELRLATLGWKAAAVDMLWAQLLTEYGLHATEHRDFRTVPMYADAILDLEPTYGPLYKFIGSLLAYRPVQGTANDVRLARGYLERGTRERPEDWRLLRDYATFLVYLAPSFLQDPQEIAEWRKTGANAMVREVALGGYADDALSAASLLTGQGRSRDAIPLLYRSYELTSDPSMADVHDQIRQELAALQATAWRQEADDAETTINGRWVRELPFVGRNLYMVLGPFVDPARCAGVDRARAPECVRDWPGIVGSPADVSSRETSASSP